MFVLLTLASAHADAEAVCDLAPAVVSEEFSDLVFIKVVNLGTARCAGFWLDVWVDAPAAPWFGDYGDFFHYFPNGLEPGGQTAVTMYIPGSNTRTDRFWIDMLVDTDQWVSESDEGNNLWSVWVNGAVEGWYHRQY
jgi:hypothetical protein